MTKNKLKAILPLSHAIAAILQAHAFAQTATPAKTPDATSGDLEEIVVTGLRASLEKSLDIDNT